ncbi:MAG TPA: DUF6766 family protein, partial [Lacipirellulaceae bacterium]|nr:DUF6766 family protein [Lacipirellulaceae bacterium]
NKRKLRDENRRFPWIYRHSFFMAFLVLFAFFFVLHVIFGAQAYNEDRAFAGQPAISIAAFLLSAKFWSSTLQTWQAEYLSIALFVVLSIYLRQQGSAESKPIASRSQTTGAVNK